LISVGNLSVPFQRTANSANYSEWKPHPSQFTPDDTQTGLGEEARYADGRNDDWAPGKEISLILKWREKRHTQSAIG
jgi:hypothetical protein